MASVNVHKASPGMIGNSDAWKIVHQALTVLLFQIKHVTDYVMLNVRHVIVQDSVQAVIIAYTQPQQVTNLTVSVQMDSTGIVLSMTVRSAM
jgi:hypothetical protein